MVCWDLFTVLVVTSLHLKISNLKIVLFCKKDWKWLLFGWWNFALFVSAFLLFILQGYLTDSGVVALERVQLVMSGITVFI